MGFCSSLHIGQYCHDCIFVSRFGFMEITSYLWQLEKMQIYHLGLVLGLSQHHMKNLKDSETFLDDVIMAWLRQEDQVQCVGQPSWQMLMEALRHERVGQNGIACAIAKDKGLKPTSVTTGSAESSTTGFYIIYLFSLVFFVIICFNYMIKDAITKLFLRVMCDIKNI